MSDVSAAGSESYSYDAMERLDTTWRNGVAVDRRLYDGANRVIASGAVGGLTVDSANPAVDGRTSQHDANGRLVHQNIFAGGVWKTAVDYNQYDAAGNLLGYLSADVGSVTMASTLNTLERAEGYRQRLSMTASHVVAGPGAGGAGQIGGVAYGYDANGALNFVGDAGQISQPTLRTHRFVNDANGNALYAYYANENTPGEQAFVQRQLIVNGEVLGRYGATADHSYDGTVFAQMGTFFKSDSEFSFGYQPIDGNYPAGSPGTYAVAAGDTLQTIAKGAYGDANLWYLIADANGLSSNGDLRAGQVLTIPTAVGSANSANTFRPYDPSRITGNTSATLMAQPGGRTRGVGRLERSSW